MGKLVVTTNGELQVQVFCETSTTYDAFRYLYGTQVCCLRTRRGVYIEQTKGSCVRVSTHIREPRPTGLVLWAVAHKVGPCCSDSTWCTN